MSTRGFTLIETIIYIALFGLLITGAVIGAYNLLEGGRRNVDATGIQEEGTFLNRKISWALSGATSASVSESGEELTIVRADLGAQSPLVISGNGTILTIARGVSGTPTQLNSDRYPVSDVRFVYTIGVNGRPPSVSVNFMIEGKAFNLRKYIR